MIYTPKTKDALKLCYMAHKDQVDKAGLPYVFHPFHLAEQMLDEDTTVVALLHDVLEDTEITLDAMRKAGYGEDILEALQLLCHEDGVPYMDYIKRLRENRLARIVKLADLQHNSDLSRLDVADERAVARREKYLAAMQLLMNEACEETV